MRKKLSNSTKGNLWQLRNLKECPRDHWRNLNRMKRTNESSQSLRSSIRRDRRARWALSLFSFLIRKKRKEEKQLPLLSGDFVPRVQIQGVGTVSNPVDENYPIQFWDAAWSSTSLDLVTKVNRSSTELLPTVTGHSASRRNSQSLWGESCTSCCELRTRPTVLDFAFARPQENLRTRIPIESNLFLTHLPFATSNFTTSSYRFGVYTAAKRNIY